MADVCGIEFTNFFNGTIMPLVAYASIVTTIIIALSFMVGRTIANAKLTLWAKTEIVQLVISLSSVLLIMAALSSISEEMRPVVSKMLSRVGSPLSRHSPIILSKVL